MAPSLRAARAELSQAADQIFARCMQKSPADRYQIYDEFIAALAPIAESKGSEIESCTATAVLGPTCTPSS